MNHSFFICFLCFLGTLVGAEGLEESFRINLADYQPGKRLAVPDAYDGRAAVLPAAFGIHCYGTLPLALDHWQVDEHGEPVKDAEGQKVPRLKGGDQGCKFAAFHLKAEQPVTVTIHQNRVFEAIGPERINQETGPIVVENGADIMPVVRDIHPGWTWITLRVSPYMRELRYELKASGNAVCDTVVFGNTDDFAIDTIAPEKIRHFQLREPRTAFADHLFETNPTMPLQEYAETVARHLGIDVGTKAASARTFVDENGACLHGDGKPYFPMMMFHSKIEDWQLNQMPLNVITDAVWPVDGRPNYRKYNQVTWPFMFRDCCYELFAQNAAAQDNDYNQLNAANYYIYDEPDLYYDPIALERMNKLIKVSAPRVPTFTVFCMFRNPPEAYRTSDYVGFDHYPIGQTQSWFSVEAIGWMVDRLRWCSGNHPVISTIQAIPGTLGNYPTRREMACMTLLSVAHGVRGIYFYAWNEHGQATLQQLNPACYENFKELVFLLGRMEKALIGPEVFLPWTATGEAKARICISADRTEAYLVLANSRMHANTLKLTPQKNFPLETMVLTNVFCDGVSFTQNANAVTAAFEKYGCAVYKLQARGLDKLVKMTDADVMNALKNTASDVGNATKATAEQAETLLKK